MNVQYYIYKTYMHIRVYAHKVHNTNFVLFNKYTLHMLNITIYGQ